MKRSVILHHPSSVNHDNIQRKRFADDLIPISLPVHDSIISTRFPIVIRIVLDP